MKKTTNKILLSTIISLAVIIFAGTIICIKIALNNINSEQDFYNENDVQLTTSTKTFEEDFHAVRNNVIANVTITQGKTAEIKIKTTPYIYDHLTTIVKDGVLVIDMAKCNVGNDYTCEIEIVMPKCTSIYNMGIGKIDCLLMEGDNVRIENEGVGNIFAKNIKSNNAIIHNDGVGSIECSQVECESVSVNNEGVGNIIVREVKTENSEITNNGIGQVEAQAIATDVLTVDNEGVGGIIINGNAKKADITNNGAGKVNVRNLNCSDTKIRNDGVGAIEK